MNIYLQQITSISLPNKYTKWYCNIINNALRTKNEGYTENHHILPKSFQLGGEKDKENLVTLTAREHFICHRLLTKMSQGKNKSKMWYALWLITNSRKDRSFRSGKQYALMREQISIIHRTRIVSDETRRKQSINIKGKSTGWHHSEEAKQKISSAHKGKPGRKWSVDEKAAHSASHSGVNHQNYGIPHCAERRAKISAGLKKSYHKILVSCVKCKTVTTIGNYTKHHGQNCKR